MRTRLLAAAIAALCVATSARAATWDVVPYPPVPGALDTELWGLNDHGVVVGTTESGGFIDDHGHRTWYAFANPAGINYLAGISNDGVLIGGDGSTGFIDDHGTITQVSVPGATQTFVRGISANGRYVAGTWLVGTSLHGYILDRTTSALTLVEGRNGGSVSMVDVNDSGIAVGVAGNGYGSVVVDLHAGTSTWFDAADGFSQLRFLTINDAGEIAGRGDDADLHWTGLIGSIADGFTAFDPQSGGFALIDDLNNAGQAVGALQYSNGDYVNFIAAQVSAVPEPAPALLLGSGLLAAGLLARRRREAAR